MWLCSGSASPILEATQGRSLGEVEEENREGQGHKHSFPLLLKDVQVRYLRDLCSRAPSAGSNQRDAHVKPQNRLEKLPQRYWIRRLRQISCLRCQLRALSCPSAGSTRQKARSHMTSHDSRAEGSTHVPPLWVPVPLLCPVLPTPTPAQEHMQVSLGSFMLWCPSMCQSLSYHFEKPSFQTLNTHLQHHF